MTAIGRNRYYNEIVRNSDINRRISVAIKNSNVFAHIKPINLLKQRLGIPIVGTDLSEGVTCKKQRLQNTINREAKCTSIIVASENSVLSGKEGAQVSDTVIPKNPSNVSYELLPTPDTLFDGDTCVLDETSIKSENLDGHPEIPIESRSNIFQEEYLRKTNIISEKLSNLTTDIDRTERSFLYQNNKNKLREKKTENLFSLAASLLPVPSKFCDKNLLISSIESGVDADFISLFKEAIAIENQISTEDLHEIIDSIVQQKATYILPELCQCLEFIPYYAASLSESFIKHNVDMKNYKDDILNCLLTMIDSDASSTVIAFIEACYYVKDWNKMWSGVLTKHPTYKFDEKYFMACMENFQNLNANSATVNHDTMIIIISYIMRNYYENYEMYMADIWLYCVLATDITSESDLNVPKQILDKVIDKLILMKNPSFLFIMNLLSKNWSLLCNNSFCTWLSELIADKSDVKKCLLTLSEFIESISVDNSELNNTFLLLSINVMSVLNKKSLFTCSKNVYSTFLEGKLDKLKTLLSKHNEMFKYKWIIVECLISATEYQNALDFLKEFDVLKDLEISFIEYSRVKDILPNLVWHLLSISNMLPVIDLFEQVVSIFIFNETTDSSYTKNCNEIFDLIVVKAFESNDKEVVLKMILLLDHILSADIEFNISKDCLRYLLIAAVRTNIPFNDLLDFIDLCFKFDIFETIQTTTDGFGSFVEVGSNLTKEEIMVLSTWLCRHVKIKLVELAQTEGSSIRENLMKVCFVKFVLRPSKTPDSFIQKLGLQSSFNDFVSNFTESLTCPKYLSHPIKFTSNSDVINEVSIICDNRVVYNAIYYSDI